MPPSVATSPPGDASQVATLVQQLMHQVMHRQLLCSVQHNMLSKIVACALNQLRQEIQDQRQVKFRLKDQVEVQN